MGGGGGGGVAVEYCSYSNEDLHLTLLHMNTIMSA